MLIYIAGRVTIPAELYEAAAIDGASGWQRLTRLTLPMVSGFILINTILGFKGYLNAYDIIVGLTDGGPGTEIGRASCRERVWTVVVNEAVECNVKRLRDYGI